MFNKTAAWEEAPGKNGRKKFGKWTEWADKRKTKEFREQSDGIWWILFLWLARSLFAGLAKWYFTLACEAPIYIP